MPVSLVAGMSCTRRRVGAITLRRVNPQPEIHQIFNLAELWNMMISHFRLVYLRWDNWSVTHTQGFALQGVEHDAREALSA